MIGWDEHVDRRMHTILYSPYSSQPLSGLVVTA